MRSCMWWDDNGGELAFANLEDIAANPVLEISDLVPLSQKMSQKVAGAAVRESGSGAIPK
jgi:hypothetical protein